MATIRRLRGRWQAIVRRRGVPPRCKSFDKRTDATRWAREIESEADRSGWVADTRLAEKTTLAELLTRYRDQVSPTKRSALTERSRINAMLRRPIVHRTLAKLTSADVATYRDERLKDAAPATVVRELNTLSHAIETALREWGLWLPRNPVKLVRRPSVPQGRKRRLEDGEEERLLAACDRGRTPLLKQLVILAWLQSRPPWEARVGAEVLFTRTFEEAAENSRTRCDYLVAWPGPFGGGFEWMSPPVLNSQTRLAVEMSPATGVLRAIGYEQAEGQELPEPVTMTCEQAAAAGIADIRRQRR